MRYVENKNRKGFVATEADFEPSASLAPIKKFFLNQGSDYWKEVSEHLLSGNIVIPNKKAWDKDFILGGTDYASLTSLIFEPNAYTQDPEKFNPFGNLFMGDVISLLNSCSYYGVEEMNVLDFGVITAFIAAALSQNTKKATKISYVGSVHLDWITRCMITALTSNRDVNKTNINLHIPNYFCTCYQFNNLINKFNILAKDKTLNVKLGPGDYQGLTVSSYFTLISGLNVRAGFKTPNLTVHEMKVTALEKHFIRCCAEEEKEYETAAELFRKGPDRFFLGRISHFGGDDTQLAKYDKDTEELYLPNPYCERIHNYLFTRKKNPPKFLKVVQDNPCRFDMKIPEYPIASCIVDIKKVSFENSTKDDKWVLALAQDLYTYAQDINKLRHSNQSNGTDKPLHVEVILPNDRPEMCERLKEKIEWTTVLLRTTHDLNYTYEFVGGN